MKSQNLLEELNKLIEDKGDSREVLESLLGYIMCSTQEAAVVPPYVALAIDQILDSGNLLRNGFSFISKFMTSRLHGNSKSAKPLLKHLQALYYKAEDLMMNGTLDTVTKLQSALIVFVSTIPKEIPFLNFEQRFKEWGFERGWGNTAESVQENVRMLSEVLQAPEPAKLELLFSRLPDIFCIVIISPHGYFGQLDVLGLPDTCSHVNNAFKHH
ncbi:hypothetical protein I3760_15G151400 [Carya illinoinensis]|uniref:sucrose synthase n=1 Tax=Carya illinoinensis TaxID=32201 RepID=A0A922A9J0_CARIL|nr:hypothetical protein I3760_15G151400 [Carya illinoinensis]KAG6676475.1 hypothetical protein I3842_15G153000 [Carya illinoinensis]